ncbi:MAG: EamA family transporter [Caldilineaceae bacterium]|nr:EamA family transporter [Caldilineaceae bacterium]
MYTQLIQTFPLILLSIASGVAGQTVIKVGVSQPHNADAASGILALVTAVTTSPLILTGLALYGMGALAWIAVLSKLDLSYAYPFLALNFVLITLVSVLFLGENVSLTHWFGIGIIVAGVIVVSRNI